MNYLNLLSSIVLIGSSSALLVSPGEAVKDDYYLMENKDVTLTGYGSVTEELKEAGIDVDSYKVGFKQNDEFLLCQESNDEIYLYYYFVKPEDFRNYDYVSVALYDGAIADWEFNIKKMNWTDLKLEIVSYDDSKTLVKYKIEDVKIDKTEDHVYLFREIFNHYKKDQVSYQLKVGMLYAYNSQRDQFVVKSEQTISIRNKVVGYQLYPYTDLTDATGNKYSALYQRSYTGFSLADIPNNEKVNDLIDVTLTYNPTYYGGYTTIPLNYTGQGSFGFMWNMAREWDKKIGDLDVYKNMDKSIIYQEYKPGAIVKTVEHEDITVTYKESDTGFGSWSFNDVKFENGTDSLKYNTIESKADVDPDIITSNPKLENCDWFVSFDNRPISCLSNFTFNMVGAVYQDIKSHGNIFVGVDSASTPNTDTQFFWCGKQLKITNEWAKKNIKFDSTNYKGMMVKSDDVSILHLTYKTDTGVNDAIAVDTYDKTTGQIVIQDDTTISDFDRWVRNMKEGFLKVWAYLKWVLLGLAGVAVIFLIVKLVMYLRLTFKK